ncbi:MAG: hypothetical protein IPM91_16725 [Bacteroidetes bacterium]|nr:hypothetical protein [Bacteroidota bacterium]
MKKHFITLLLFVAPIATFSQHIIITKNGERLNGELQRIENNTVTFFHKGSTVTFQLGQIKSIDFEGEPGTASSQASTGQKGVSFIMPGRKLTKQPKVDNLTMERGIVVVGITINKYGDVVKADPGVEGTTTTSQYLLTKAKQAAESAKFDGGTTMPLEQKGTITVTF